MKKINSTLNYIIEELITFPLLKTYNNGNAITLHHPH